MANPSYQDQGTVDHHVKAPIPPYNPPRVKMPDGRTVTVEQHYQYHEYPKLALKRATKDDIDEALQRAENFDEKRNVMRYVKRPPRVGELIPLRDPESGQDVVFQNADEEKAFFEMYPDIDKIETGSGHPPITFDDPDYQDFLKFKAAKKEGIRQGGMFASVVEERADLLRRAAAIPLKVDNRWNHETLRASVIKAEADAKASQE